MVKTQSGLRVYADGDVEEENLAEAISLGMDKQGQVELAVTTKIRTKARSLSVEHGGEKVKVGAGTAKVLYDKEFSTKLAAAFAEASALLLN